MMKMENWKSEIAKVMGISNERVFDKKIKYEKVLLAGCVPNFANFELKVTSSQSFLKIFGSVSKV